jgi:hypothetical protein
MLSFLSKIVLSRFAGYKSCCDTIFNTGTGYPENKLPGLRYLLQKGAPIPAPGFAEQANVMFDSAFHGDWSKENVLQSFREHNERVKATVPPEKLLVIDVTAGDGEWNKICSFLNVPVPSQPFPKSNDTAEFLARLEKANEAGLAAMAAEDANSKTDSK